MMGEAAHLAGVSLTVLATSPDDSAIAMCDHFIVGAATDSQSLEQLAERVQVITFDHELIDLEQIDALESRGVVVRPNAHALQFAVDKAHQRTEFERAGVAVPRFTVIRSAKDPALEHFLGEFDHVVVKAARGGYDGRGVLFPTDHDEARSFVDALGRDGDVVVEQRLTLLGELAQVIVRGVDGDCVAYPLVSTTQSAGMCIEVVFPADVDDETARSAERIGREIAELIGAVGIVAVELFLTDHGLLVNEIALRPHNTGHWTIEGAATSQFTNHLRAVIGAPLGPAHALVKAAVMVNVVGADAPGSLGAAMGVEGAHVHDYGKSWRPGRKLGHVTVVGDDLGAAHVRAWESARAYGTRTREE
jgi:5-(carboxyamino)imidazole ribonucleotide synthase